MKKKKILIKTGTKSEDSQSLEKSKNPETISSIEGKKVSGTSTRLLLLYHWEIFKKPRSIKRGGKSWVFLFMND